ncbi:MAG: M28 family peptidase [Candidatus Hydrogenedentota bacterium]
MTNRCIHNVRRAAILIFMGLHFGFSTVFAQGIERSKPHVPTNDEMFGWVEDIVAITEGYPEFRRMGTEGDHAVRAYIVNRLKSFGIADVEEQQYDLEYRHYEKWNLDVKGESIPAYFMRGAGFAPRPGVSGELVFVGESIPRDTDFTGKVVVFEVRGQSVPGAAAPLISDFIHDPNGTLATGTFGGKAGAIPSNFPVSYYQASDQGATAMIAILKDYDTGTNKFYPDPSAMVQTRIPGLYLGKYDGEALLAQIEKSKNPIQASVVIQGEVRKSTSANIVATLPGQKKDTIIVNTHHDAGFAGAVQDGSGISSVLGLAKYFSKVPSNFRQKELVFVFDGSHYDWNYPMGANIFANQNPEVMDNTVLAIGIEHIAQKFAADKDGYHDTGEIEPRVLFTPPNQLLYDATVRSIKQHNLHNTIIPRKGALTMFGETQSYYLKGIPSYSFISGPEYLFLGDDTIDKVARDQFEPVVKTFISIIDSAMYLPGSWLTRVDR